MQHEDENLETLVAWLKDNVRIKIWEHPIAFRVVMILLYLSFFTENRLVSYNSLYDTSLIDISAWNCLPIYLKRLK